MTAAWRFHTDPITCLRVWRWYEVVGRPEVAHAVTACVRTLPLVLATLPAVPMVGAPPIQPYPEIRGTSYQVPASPAGVSPVVGTSDAAGFAPVFPAAPYAAAIKAASPAGTAPGASGYPSSPAPHVSVQPPIAPSAPERPAPFIDTFDVPNLLIPAAPAIDTPAQPVPEPTSLALLGVACMALGVLRRWGRYP